MKEFIQYILSANEYIQVLAVMSVAFFAALIVLPFVAGIVKFLTRKTETDVDDKLIAALNRPIFNIVLLIGVLVALPILSLPAYSVLITKTFFVLVISKGIIRVAKVLLEGAAEYDRVKSINTQTLPLFNNLILMVVILAALYTVFLVWGIDVTAWLAGAGILGIAIGFAAKDTLSNLISGAFILADKPYSIGDYIVLGSGITGIVSAVGLRSTRIRTFDDEEVTVPNGIIANEALINKSTGPDTGRVKVKIGVAYGSDLKKVETLLLDIANANSEVLDDPAASVSFTDFSDSAIDFRLSCRVKDPLDVFGVKSELRYAIYNRFAENNIEIPFPQRDVNIKK